MRGETNERKFAMLTQRLSQAKCANYEAVSGFVELLHSAFSWQETYTILMRRFEARSFPSLLMYNAFSFLSDRRVNSSPCLVTRNSIVILAFQDDRSVDGCDLPKQLNNARNIVSKDRRFGV